MRALLRRWMSPGAHGARTSLGLLLFRCTLGGLMIVQHGWGKTLKVLDGNFKFADPLGIGQGPSLVLAAGGETLAPALLVVGLATRLAAVPAAITMAVAAFITHGADPLAKKELALLYLVGFVLLALTGAGRYSLDARLGRR